jgi:hypothetical protein
MAIADWVFTPQRTDRGVLRSSNGIVANWTKSGKGYEFAVVGCRPLGGGLYYVYGWGDTQNEARRHAEGEAARADYEQQEWDQRQKTQCTLN